MVDNTDYNREWWRRSNHGGSRRFHRISWIWKTRFYMYPWLRNFLFILLCHSNHWFFFPELFSPVILCKQNNLFGLIGTTSMALISLCFGCCSLCVFLIFPFNIDNATLISDIDLSDNYIFVTSLRHNNRYYTYQGCHSVPNGKQPMFTKTTKILQSIWLLG